MNVMTRSVFAGVAVVAAAAFTSGAAAAVGEVTMSASVDGRDVEDAGVGDPIELDPAQAAEVHVVVTNDGDEPVQVRDVTLEGAVIGVTFLAYDTDVNIEVEPGDTEEVVYDLPLRGLEEQAVGLLPATLAIHGEDGDELDAVSFTVDVDGSASSVFARLGIFLAAVTAGTLLLNLWLVLRRRLPPNRVARAMRFAITGLGLGLTLTVALAATRILPPYASAWVPLVVVPTGLAVVLGFLSPGPLAHAWPEDEIDVAVRETIQSQRAAAETAESSTDRS
jgi:hypothetical protein